MSRRECLHLPPFFALPFAFFHPCLLSMCKCLVMFCPRSRKGVPKLFTPNRQTRFVLELVLNASYCNSNSSVRPCERWVVSAYATWPRPEGTPGLQATLLMLVLHLLVQCSCRIFVTTWCCRKTRSDRQWHHGVSSLCSMRQRFSYGVVQQNYAEWIRGRLVDELFTRMLSSSRYLDYILSGSTSGRSCGDHRDNLWRYEIVCKRRPLQTSGGCRANKCFGALCKERFQSF